MVALWLLCPVVALGKIIKVDASIPANATQNGVDWVTAFKTLQQALDVAEAGDDIWIAGGTYYPTKAANIFDERTKAFWTFGGIKLYGGFNQSTDNYSFATRDPALFPVILSGEIQQDGNPSNNAYCVLKTYANNGLAVLDGITITGAYDINGYGGGLYLNSVSPTITNCTFIGNFAFQGAGIFCDNIFGASSPVITNCRFFNNTTGTAATGTPSGGAICAKGGNIQIIGCTFTGNSARIGSAVVISGGGNPVISNSTFTGNVTSFSDQNSCVIYNFGNSCSITTTVVANNGARALMFQDASGAVNTCTINNNNGGGGFLLRSNTTIANCYFRDNTNANLSTSLGTYGDGKGGGLHISGAVSGTPAVVYNCLFAKNRAEEGGGLYIQSNTSNSTHKGPRIINCTIADNSLLEINGGMPYRGGGVFCKGDASSFLYITASYGYEYNTKFQNCIIWNKKGVGGNNFDNHHFRPTNSSTSGLPTFWAKPFYENCLFGSGTPETGTYNSTSGGVNYNGTCIQNANPLFENPEAGNYALTFCSRAINAGNNALLPGFITGDLEGQPRIFDGVIDMGSFEKQSPPEGKRVFLPPVNVCEGGSAMIWGELRTVSGTYDTLLVATNGCDSVRSVVFTVRPNPIANVSYADNCNTTGIINVTPVVGTALFSITLNGNNQVVGAGGTASYSGLSAGNYPYTISDAYGCVMNATASLVTYNIPDSRLYVDWNATGNGNGLNWANAFTNFQSALDLAACSNINEIWVAEGVYVPSKDPAGNITATPSATFRMYDDVAIYGGFSPENGVTGMGTRNPKLYRTVLSGDMQLDGNPGNNAYNVINNYGLNLNNSAVLDGFVISDAWNNASAQGGGIINYLSSPTFRNCEISNNFAGGLNNARGGGMCNIQCAPVVENCAFINNLASGVVDAYGGAIANIQSGITLKGCTFRGNNCSAPNTVGGGIYSANSTLPTVIDNCLFAQNTQGALCADGSTGISINNTTIAGNSGNVSAPGGLYLINTSPLISNTIVWGNTQGNVLNVSASPTFFYCLVQGSGAPGSWNGAFGINAGANIDVNPLFENDHQLSICSPAKDAGNPAAYGGPTAPTDLNGNTRIVGIGLDMGCYEYQGTQSFSGTVYVNHAATGANDGSSWANAFTDLQAALDRANCLPITEIWVSEGTYYPTRAANGDLTNSQFATFRMRNGVAIYGGFSVANGIATFGARNPSVHTTVLSGEIQQDGIASNNAYNVINNYQNGLDNSAVLDGFTISDAFNSYDISGGSGNTIGGGIINVSSSPRFANCIIKNNVVQAINNGYGAGMYNANANPIVENCVFENNAVNASFIAYGGGISNSNSGITLKRTSFERNTTSAPNRVGGGFYSAGFLGETDMDNCLFAGNNDGGICVDGTHNMTINNTTIADNQGNPASAGGLYSINCSPLVSNSIIHGNTFGNVENFSAGPSFFYCLVSGSGAPGGWNPAYGVNAGANKDENPQFASGYRLNACSPAVDAGNPAAYSKPIAANDLSGDARIVNGILDMGCYEYTGVPIGAYGSVLYVNETATGANNGLNWADAFTDLQSALNIAKCGAVAEIWVSEGTYTPTIDPNGFFTTSPGATFRMQNNLAIYGGFSVADGVTTFGARNWKLHPAILSGDIQRDGVHSNNAYNVINNYNNGLDATAVLDGFTISGAWNNASGVGGGIINYLSSPTFRNCTVTGNFAGGVNNARGAGASNIQCSPTFTHCVFTQNGASGIVDAYGAGMSNQMAGVILSHCDFQFNNCSAPNVVGGGLYSFGSTLPTVIDNCLFANNNFGGMCIDGSADVSINNITVTANNGNASSLAGGLFFLNCSPFVSNSIVVGNTNGNVHNISAGPNFFYCLVEGSGAPGAWDPAYGVNFGANLDADPRLSPSFSPYACSPAVNAGNPLAYSNPIALTDLGGSPRILNGILDLGCFEVNTEVLHGSVNATICSTGSYELGGSTFTATGNYNVTLTGAAIGGCDSIVALNLTVEAATLWYADADGDGFGNPSVSQAACSQPAGHVSNADDCDDTAAGITVCIRWTGTVSHDWSTPGNWSTNAVPTSADAAFIEPGYTFNPIVGNAPGSPAQCGHIRVQPGTVLLVAPGKALTVHGDLVNHGTVQVGADATGIGSLITLGSVSGSGACHMQQYLTGAGGGTPNGLFFYVGSPVASSTAASYDIASGNKLWWADESTQSYPLISNSATPLGKGQGYIARMGATGAILFVGSGFHTGDVTIPNLSRTGTSATNRGYNLVSNPYPSTVSWDGAGRTNLSTTMWLRTHQGTTMLYDTYNATSMIGTNNNGNGAVTGDIPPTQAFWVRVPNDGETGQLSFTNAMRSHGEWSSIYKMEAEEGTVRMTLSNGTVSDEAIIVFNPDAQDGFDDFDSQKFWAAASVPQVYTTVGTDSLVINGLFSTETNPIVDLCIKAPTAGDYTITASSITLNEELWLEDKLLNNFQHLNVNPIYAFTTTSGNIGDRFALHFGALAVGAGRDVACNVCTHVFAADGMVNVTVSNPESSGLTGIITILDMAGRTVQTAAINSSRTIVATDLTTGIYLVRVETEKGAETHRVILR